MNAAWRKYPNPVNTAITGIDVLRQELSKEGVLRSERIIQSHFPIPSWVTKVVIEDFKVLLFYLEDDFETVYLWIIV